MAKFGFDLLLKQVLDYVEGELDCLKEHAIGDSPIERLFYHALSAKISFCRTELTSLAVPIDEEQFKRFLKKRDLFDVLILRSQVQLGEWRVDFVISAFDWANTDSDPSSPPVWRHLIVECDGHDFHERTKEQAVRDRSRDRESTLSGMSLFRFTGAELWRDPLGCAGQVIEWAVKDWGGR